RLRQRVYQVEAQPAKEEFLTEARFAPFLLPSHLGYLPGLTFGYLGPGGGRAALRRGLGHPLRGFASCLRPGAPCVFLTGSSRGWHGPKGGSTINLSLVGKVFPSARKYML